MSRRMMLRFKKYKSHQVSSKKGSILWSYSSSIIALDVTPTYRPHMVVTLSERECGVT